MLRKVKVQIVYHTTRLLAKFGVEKTNLVARVGAQFCFWAYFGIDSSRAPCTAMPQSKPTYHPDWSDGNFFINVILIYPSVSLA